MRGLALVVALLALGGCATQAQREGARITAEIKEATAAGKVCVERQAASAEYQALKVVS
jgi:hypothetical protein